MAGETKRVNYVSRENAVSNDFNRIGRLVGQEVENSSLRRSVRADFYDPATNTFDDFGSTARSGQAAPISSLTSAPSIDAVAASFNVVVGPFDGEVYDPTITDPDASQFAIVRQTGSVTVVWPAPALPDPGNPRICTIYAVPGDALSDLQSRNILVDPSTRATVPANTNKTSSPVATLGVTAGFPTASPAPAPIPFGTLPLFDVYVPAAAADSTAYIFTRRACRRVDFPGSSQHGIVHGCLPDLSGANAALDSGIHRLVIDGELLTFKLNAGLTRTLDATSTPGSAPANNDAPSYLYLCGGRNRPTSIFSDGTHCSPVELILSNIVPDRLGYPNATLQSSDTGLLYPQSACLYIGVAFFGAGTAVNVPAIYDGDWVRFLKPANSTWAFNQTFGAREPSFAAGGPTAVVLGSLPNPTDIVELSLASGDGISETHSFLQVGTGGSAVQIGASYSLAPASLIELLMPATKVSRAQATNLFGSSDNAAALPIPTGYTMRVPRIG